MRYNECEGTHRLNYYTKISLFFKQGFIINMEPVTHVKQHYSTINIFLRIDSMCLSIYTGI